MFLLPSSASTWGSDGGANRTVYLEYGQSAPFSLLPCDSVAAANISQTATCAAAAEDVSEGDLSQYIDVRDVSADAGQSRWA